MKLIKIVESLILEATPEQIHSAYYSYIPFDTFKRIVAVDPGTKIENHKLLKIGKYSKLLLSLVKNGGLKNEDFPKAKEYLGFIYKYNIPININNIKVLSDLYKIVKFYYAKESKDLTSILQVLEPEEYQLVFNSDKWLIYIPLTEKSACYLGVDTQWCTTWGENSLNPSYKDRTNYFHRYNQNSPLYIIINKQDNNEKYQFHFSTKQYMNSSDVQIDSGEFLNENIGIRNFFFPSFVTKIKEAQETKKEIDKIDALSTNTAVELLKKIIVSEKKNNKLVFALLNNDFKTFNYLIEDKDILEDITEIEDNNVNFYLDSGKYRYSDLDRVENVLSDYKNETWNARERVRYETVDWDISEYLINFLEEYFKNNSYLLKQYGYVNYELFEKGFKQGFITNDKIIEAYYDNYVDKNEENYKGVAEGEINSIEKYINFGDIFRQQKNIMIPVPQFIIFLMKFGIEFIKDDLMSVFDKYISYNNLQTEYEGIYEYHIDSVTYKDMETGIEEYFNEIFENLDANERCNEIRDIFSNVIDKIFNNQLTYDDEHTHIEILDTDIDCDDETIEISYMNKSTGKGYSGKVKVENLASYATNYKLFENRIKFKRKVL